ncbi:hypothetical protein ACNSTU_08865 [Aquisalimonas sp. APHAB1-3]|uniref:hypothetical protein n=1 Tax=Aquisalimonas sp. APHAB1-3 TaxID=3402080 RepID=UPI003AB0FCB7
MTLGLIAAVIGIGLIHGVLPDHGWPIAATYALRRKRRYVAGAVAALIIGVGHLLSSIALVVIFLLLAGAYDLHEARWLSVAAGCMLVLLGIWQYLQARQGHGHNHHGHAHHGHGPLARLQASAQARLGDPDQRGLGHLAIVAILLGLAHEEPVQILAICAGTAHCLTLMAVYSLAVIVAILVPTLLLVLGYQRHRQLVEQYLPHLSYLTAAILVGMGAWFILVH